MTKRKFSQSQYISSSYILEPSRPAAAGERFGMDEDEKLFERLSSAVPSIEQCTVEEVLDLLYELLRLRTTCCCATSSLSGWPPSRPCAGAIAAGVRPRTRAAGGGHSMRSTKVRAARTHLTPALPSPVPCSLTC